MAPNNKTYGSKASVNPFDVLNMYDTKGASEDLTRDEKASSTKPTRRKNKAKKPKDAPLPPSREHSVPPGFFEKIQRCFLTPSKPATTASPTRPPSADLAPHSRRPSSVGTERVFHFQRHSLFDSGLYTHESRRSPSV